MRKNDMFHELKIVIYISSILVLFLIIFSIINCYSDTKYMNSYKLSNNYVNKNKKIIIKGDKKAVIFRTKIKKIEKIDIEEYVKCVLACEMPVNFNIEALKAQAIAVRTFYYSKRFVNCSNAKDAEICDSTHCQVYENKKECLQKWDISKRYEYWNRISKAVDETKDMVILYNGKIIEYPQFFSTSWGKTESSVDVLSKNVPYLQSVKSKGEESAPKYKSNLEITLNDFINKVNSNYTNANLTNETIKNNVEIKSNTQSGAVKKIKLGNIFVTGKDFRKLFNLNSPKFEISIKDNLVDINCTGYGHGLGMSQWGANIMAKSGSNYEKILKYYYKDIKIGKIEFEK